MNTAVAYDPEAPAETQTEAPATTHEHTRTGMSKASLKQAYIDNLFYIQGRFREVATSHDLYMAAAFTVRDRMLDRWVRSAQIYIRPPMRARSVISPPSICSDRLWPTIW